MISFKRYLQEGFDASHNELSEASLGRFYKHNLDKYVILIISGCRNGDSEKEKRLKQQQIINAFKTAFKPASTKRFSYYRVEGRYEEENDDSTKTMVKEKSVMLFYKPEVEVGKGKVEATDADYDAEKALFSFGVQCAKKYNQDSFLFSGFTKKLGFYDKQGRKIGGAGNEWAELKNILNTNVPKNSSYYSKIGSKSFRYL